MNKSLLLASLLAWSAFAFGQPQPPTPVPAQPASAPGAPNTVTVYGLVDAGIQHLSKTPSGQAQTGFQDSPSQSNRLGLRGSFALLQQWVATFNLEARYFLDGGGPPAQYSSNGNVTSRLFDRQANAGLDGPLGSFKLGLVSNPVVAAHTAGDIRPAWNSGGGIYAWYRNRQIDSTCVDGLCDFTFLRRTLVYRSPAWKGVTASAFYIFTSGNTSSSSSSNNNSGYGGALGYTVGPFSANIAGQQMDDQNGKRIGTVTLLNGTYTWGPWVFKAGTTKFEQHAGGVLYRINSAVNPAPFGTIPSVEQTNRLDNLGLGYAIGKDWWLTAGAYRYRRKGDATQDIDLYTLGADYVVNRWLTAYVMASEARNGSNANQSAGYYSLTTVPGARNSALTVGLRATFGLDFGFGGNQ